MNLLETLAQLRDDIKTWVTTNINALNAKIEANTVPIDNQLDAASTNPIQNQAVSKALDDLSDKLENQPHNYNDLEDAPSIAENEQDHLLLSDAAGNVILRVDANGTHATAITLAGTDLQSELDRKVTVVKGKGLSTNDYTDQDKAKLALLNSDAAPITIDSELSVASDNPVKNKAIASALNMHIFDQNVHPGGIREDESGGFILADENSTIIMKVDSYGMHVTDLYLSGASVQNIINSKFDAMENTLTSTVVQEVLAALPKYNGGAAIY